MSESQERMMAVVEPADIDAFMAICEKWDVEAVVVGEVTDTGRLHIDWHGERVVDVPPRSVAHDGPTYHRPFARPDWQDALQADVAEALPRPASGAELRDTLLRLVASPNLCDKSWITDQYDRYVQGNTVLAQPADSGMVRVDADTNLGVSVSTDCNGRFAKLDPYTGAQLALAESFRNVATGGARPLAVSDCLNFGSPEDPDVMWQFAEACRGLKDACLELGIPVTGGNVSLYNQTGETAILPTPVVAVLGVIEDVTRRTPTGFGAEGERVFLLGETREELSGSEWAHVVARPPRRAAAARRPRGRAGARLAAAGRLARRRRHQRPRPVRRRAGPGAGGVDLRSGHRRLGLAGLGGGRRLRRAVLRVDRPRPRDGDRRAGRRAGRARRAPRRTPHAPRAHRRRHDLGRGRLRPPRRRGEGCLAGDAAGGPRLLRLVGPALGAIPGYPELELPPPKLRGEGSSLAMEVWSQLERRIARTPTTSPSAATTAAPSTPCATTSAG